MGVVIKRLAHCALQANYAVLGHGLLASLGISCISFISLIKRYKHVKCKAKETSEANEARTLSSISIASATPPIHTNATIWDRLHYLQPRAATPLPIVHSGLE